MRRGADRLVRFPSTICLLTKLEKEDNRSLELLFGTMQMDSMKEADVKNASHRRLERI
jgi:hypothetical protein